MEVPDIRYARSGDVAIAYQIVGDGPVDVIWFRGMAGDLLSSWDQPLLVRHMTGLADSARVLMFDKRGTGLSDRVREAPTLETRMDDIRAVMDASGSERAFLWSGHEGSRSAILFAATYPERTAGLFLLEPSVRGTATPDYPWAPTEEEWLRRLAEVRADWGKREFFERLLHDWAPTVADDDDFRGWFVGHMRRSLSPGAALAFFRTMMEADVTDVLPAVRVPTLIVFKPSEREQSRYVAERIQGADLVEISGFTGLFTWTDDEPHEQMMRDTTRFIESVRRPTVTDTVLATVLFTDIVDSTKRAAELGDQEWRGMLERHHALVRRCLAQHRGNEVDVAGDGFLATFDGPRRAIECAQAIVEGLDDLEVVIRAGVHTGECELVDNKVVGIAVNIGARIANEAGAGEVLVSSTVKDLVAGSRLVFEDRGERELKGAGSWRLYSVSDA